MSEQARASGTQDRDTDPGLRMPAAGDPEGIAAEPMFTITFEGRAIPVRPGETIAGALLAAGVRTLRSTRFSGAPRGMLCGIGMCFDCLVTVNGHQQRACITVAVDGDDVRPGSGEDR